jgi:hypothetical protein
MPPSAAVLSPPLLLLVPTPPPLRRRRHVGRVVCDAEERLEVFDDGGHVGPVLGAAAEAPVRHHGRPLRRQRRVLALQRWVHDAGKLGRVLEPRPHVLHQVLLPAGPALVHGLPPRQDLQEDDAEAVHVALRGQVAREDVFRGGVAMGAHHASRHVGVVALGTVFRQPEVRQLRLVLLIYMMNN